jgi:hypothetical protein
MRHLALGFAAVCSVLAGATLEGCKAECAIGSEGCECTAGGSCDAGLQCLSRTCVNAGPNFEDGAEDDTGGDPSTSGDGDPSTSGDGDPSGDGDGDPTKLDVFEPETGDDEGTCMDTGCKKVDMLFALDGSLSMTEEINALKSSQAFLGIVDALAGLNCGGIDYRIGVTGDNKNGWVVPPAWAGSKPWFDSTEYTAAEIATHFQAAATVVQNSGGASLGCEHVLSSSVALLATDNTGFNRDDALLVLVLMSDVDDYGWYDQLGGNTCGLGCQTPGQPVATLYNTLVNAVKGGDPAGVATIVIAGDPSITSATNFCGQPQSCATAYHAERLYEFADLQEGMNGYTADICAGPSAVPLAVQTALGDNIDLACQEFEPVG